MGLSSIIRRNTLNRYFALRWLRVDYRHPGLSQFGKRQINIEIRQIARFFVKLSAGMSLDHYDKITKAVYLGNVQAERNAYAIAEDRPKNAPRP